ncbi:pyroglutamyl-peptidase 1 [Adelges cooleyi]|uniref:pyroglutamyl-peptidase 1 n=1 Tax=Adelges cooleyi TaxID=133065 RepID=UPI0021809B91|nr:pyroglutamyl-peptidase 1 [Adelges cooleyi]
MSPKTVIVTGFGLFRQYTVNASWEIAKVLPETGIDKELNINLVTVEIPVSYNDVDVIVPKLWADYNPILMVHLGVSHYAKALTIETVANGHNYCNEDINGICPENTCVVDTKIETGLSIDFFKENDLCISQNAGRYLCEYIYFKSLSINKDRTIFIHVPELDEDQTAQKLAENLKFVINKLLEQLK